MQPARFRQADFSLVKINNAKSMSPAVSSGQERGLLSRTAAGNRAYISGISTKTSVDSRSTVDRRIGRESIE